MSNAEVLAKATERVIALMDDYIELYLQMNWLSKVRWFRELRAEVVASRIDVADAVLRIIHWNYGKGLTSMDWLFLDALVGASPLIGRKEHETS